MESPWEILAHIWQLSQSLMDDAMPALDELGLHPKALFLLTALEEHPFPAELARIMSLPPPTVTYIVKGLEEKGFLRRKPEPGDLRKFRLVATPAGKRAAKLGRAKIDEVFGRRLDRLGPREIEVFNEVVLRLARPEGGA